MIRSIFILVTTLATTQAHFKETCRPASCPSGFTNTGSSCYRAAHTALFGSGRVADCPSGYTNMGATCFSWRKFKTLGMGSMTCRGGEFKSGARCYKHCPTGYVHTGVSCYRGPKTLSLRHLTCNSNETLRNAYCCAPDLKAKVCRKGTCPATFVNTGFGCFRTAHTASLGSGRVADCPSGYRNMGATCYNWRKVKSLGMGSMTCRAGEFKSGARCYKHCPAGYTHTGVSCYRGPKSISLDHITCRSNEKRDGHTCCTF